MKKISLSIMIALTGAAQAATINGIKHQPRADGQYEIVFQNAGLAPRAFTTTAPYTVVLDFADTRSSLSTREVNIAKNGIYDIDLIEGSDRTRAVVNLVGPLGYQIYNRGSDVVLVLERSASPVPAITTQIKPLPGSNTVSSGLFHNIATTSAPAAPIIAPPVSAVAPITAASVSPRGLTTPQVTPVAAPPPKPGLEPVFNQPKKGRGVLTFTLPSSVTDVNLRQDGNKVIASLNGYYATKADQKRMEVGSHDTPVEFVDIFSGARGTEIVLEVKRNTAFEFASYQGGNVYTVEVQRKAADTSLQKQVDELQGFSPTKHYNGANLSLNFQDIEVRAVLQIIAEFTNNNIVVSDAVTGNITLRLDSVPWDQALDIILKTKGLGMRKNGSVIYIAPASELDQRELDALKTIQQRDQLVPAQTELVQVKYADASELVSILEKSRAGQGEGAASSDAILSSKGTVSVDQRTNTLLVSDIPSKLQKVRDLVARLDEPVRQVLVDARLVLTNEKFSRNLGAKFGLSFFNMSKNGLITGSGNADAASELTKTLVNNVAAGGTSTIEMPALGNRLGIDMPVAGSNYGLAILGSDFLVDLELSALQTEGKLEIVSSPRVVTQDGKRAKIAKGQEKRYIRQTDSGSATDFREATLSIDVIPRIAPDERINMELVVTKDDFANDTTKNVNQIETTVLVDNGETIVLGGVYEQTQGLSSEKVPLLGDLPIIGNAFKKTENRFDKDELLIFVTPRIIDNRLSDYDKFSNLRN